MTRAGRIQKVRLHHLSPRYSLTSIIPDQVEPSHRESDEASDCPVDVGQLVHVQIVPRTSIEGYSMQAVDPSYWHDPSLSSDEWRTFARPAIVINSAFDQSSSLYKILVVSLGRGIPAEGTHILPVSTPLSVQGGAVVPEPAWPMPETYCYAFPRATWFYCLPGQVWIVHLKSHMQT